MSYDRELLFGQELGNPTPVGRRFGVSECHLFLGLSPLNPGAPPLDRASEASFAGYMRLGSVRLKEPLKIRTKQQNAWTLGYILLHREMKAWAERWTDGIQD